jgi:hypothetical protein
MKPNENTVLRVANENLTYRDVHIAYPNPTGAQILAAAGAADQQGVLLQVLPSGDLESIRPAEAPNLAASTNFIAGEGDRSFFFTIDDSRLEWFCRHISGSAIRKLAKIDEDRELLQKCGGGEPVVLERTTMVDLGKAGVERIVTGQRKWKLRVQAVTLTYAMPEVKVADAMKEAGFDPNKAWNIFLIVAGQPKKPVDINYIVDLRTPGIEKIRLMPRNVDNGDGQQRKPRREFELLPVDVRYLDGAGLRWETILCDDRRWLVLHDYELLFDYTPAGSTLALDIPKNYPTAQIDMFYFAPALSRCDGREIPQTQVRANIEGVTYQGWSRHRNQNNPWDPHTDNVATHLALVESCLAREFGD